MERRQFLRAGGSAAVAGLGAGCIGDDERDGGSDGDAADGDTSDGDGSGGGSADGGDGGSTGGTSGPITIGALEPLSGNFTPWGRTHLAGLEFAIEEINGKGGVEGADLELVVEDTESDPTSANSIYQRFADQEDIVAATGPVSSDVGIRTARTAEELEIPLLLHMAGSAEVLSRESRYTFRVGLLPAPTTMRGQAQIVERRGYERVGAIVASYAWGESVKNGIRSEFPVDVNIQEASLGTSDFRPFLRQFPSDLEMLISTGHPPGAISIASQAVELGYSPGLVTESGIPPAVLWDALGETAIDVNQTHVHLTDVSSDAFRAVAKRFADATGERMGTHEGYGYVTGQLLAQAIREAGSTSPPAIADAIRTISFETLYAEPIEYTEWGELKNQRHLYSRFERGAPSYASDGDWKLTEFFRTDPLEPYDPGA